ncbi:MAG: amino acid permease [Bacteroidia bacterium]|nr:amino acid permease [Bacteroidia bacterium]
MSSSLFRRKSAAALEAESASSGLKRALGPVQLTFMGIGAIIGTGIFVLTGQGAAGDAGHLGAGPALIYSFILSGLACAFAALCYAEFASMIPISGSAYTYSYASFGELIAWIIGWDLVLEYAVGNIAVAIGWSGYFKALLAGYGIVLPAIISMDPATASHALNHVPEALAQLQQLLGQAFTVPQVLEQIDVLKTQAPDVLTPSIINDFRNYGAASTLPTLGGFPLTINLPAVLITLLITVLLVVGIQESARTNAVLVIIKLFLIGLFIVFGLPHMDTATHWQNFMPNGWPGVFSAAAIVFFAYIGFDAVSTTAEEAKNPQRDLPIGMIASLVVCTLLYVVVAAVLTGMAPLEILGNEKPIAAALTSVGENRISAIISAGVTITMPTVLLVMQLGQVRVFYSMSRDGLLPARFSKVSPRFKTPVFSTILVGLFVGLFAGLIDIGDAAELTNIGTLFAFVLVAIGVWILRVQEPDRKRSFKVPAYQLMASLCVLSCGFLMLSLPMMTWIRFVVWMGIGIVIYFLYGRRHSKLNS